jgi:glycosyltransferase involved in cell wall biosynthesis
MQQLDGGFEVLISEDCSTDGTREIVREYAARNPERIRLLLSERNVRSNAVVTRGIEAARGQYVALLDGDDYWISPDKLQKQATFLDRHPECTICFHNARVTHEDRTQPDWNWTAPNHPAVTTLDDLWLGNYIATCSTMFRRGAIGSIPAWYESFFPITDWPLHLLNAERGHIGYINEVLGVYRYHAGGCYSVLTQPEKLATTLDFYRRMNACLGYRYDDVVRSAISKYCIEWAEEYLKRGDKQLARRCYRDYLRGRPVNRHVSWRRMIVTGLRVHLPEVAMNPLRRIVRAARRPSRSALVASRADARHDGHPSS